MLRASQPSVAAPEARATTPAEALLKQIAPGGTKAAQALSRLIDLKDTAHYGIINVTAPKLKNALRDATHLVNFADQVLNR
jgi:hypothetical protein